MPSGGTEIRAAPNRLTDGSHGHSLRCCNSMKSPLHVQQYQYVGRQLACDRAIMLSTLRGLLHFSTMFAQRMSISLLGNCNVKPWHVWGGSPSDLCRTVFATGLEPSVERWCCLLALHADPSRLATALTTCTERQQQTCKSGLATTITERLRPARADSRMARVSS